MIDFHLQPSATRCATSLLLVLALSLLAGCVSADAIKERNARVNTSSQDSPWEINTAETITHPQVRTFAEAMALPDERFDLALALLLFAKEEGKHDIDIDAMLYEIDQAIADLRRQVAPYKSRGHRKQMLRTFVHQRMRFEFDRSDPKGRESKNLFFDQVWQRRKGYCVTLSMVYLVLARGAGIPLAGTRLPGHFAVLDPDHPDEGVLETTSNGRPRSQHELYDHFLISREAVETYGAFMVPLSDKQLFSTMYNNLGGLAVWRGDEPAALKAYNEALRLDSRNIEALYNRAGVNMESKETPAVQQALADLNKAIQSEPNFYPGYCRRALLLHRFGRLDDANRDLRRARGIYPDKPYADVVEGVMRYREGEKTAAAEAFARALEKDSKDENALRNLAIVEAEQGNMQRSEELRARLRKITNNPNE